MKVARLYRFDASHSLPGVAGYDQPHDHRYTVEVAKSGVPAGDGMIVDTQVLDDVYEPLCASLEGTDLNAVCAPSTVENLAQWFAGKCPVGYVVVTVWEDDDRWGQVAA